MPACLPVSLSVSLSVCLFTIFLRNGYLTFLVFYIMPGFNSYQKLMERVFLGKFLLGHIWVKGTKNDPKGGFILFIDKNLLFNCPDRYLRMEDLLSYLF